MLHHITRVCPRKRAACYTWEMPKIPDEKLEKVSDRINKALERVEENEKMNSDKKDKVISQLLALLEIINEKIEYNEEYSVEIDLEALLSV